MMMMMMICKEDESSLFFLFSLFFLLSLFSCLAQSHYSLPNNPPPVLIGGPTTSRGLYVWEVHLLKNISSLVVSTSLIGPEDNVGIKLQFVGWCCFTHIPTTENDQRDWKRCCVYHVDGTNTHSSRC